MSEESEKALSYNVVNALTDFTGCIINKTAEVDEFERGKNWIKLAIKPIERKETRMITIKEKTEKLKLQQDIIDQCVKDKKALSETITEHRAELARVNGLEVEPKKRTLRMMLEKGDLKIGNIVEVTNTSDEIIPVIIIRDIMHAITLPTGIKCHAVLNETVVFVHKNIAAYVVSQNSPKPEEVLPRYVMVRDTRKYQWNKRQLVSIGNYEGGMYKCVRKANPCDNVNWFYMRELLPSEKD